MSKWKRILAALLSALMLVSVLPAAALAKEPQEGTEKIGEIMPNSLLPLNEYEATLDMTGYLPEELKEVPLSDILNNLTYQYSEIKPTIAQDAAISWAKGNVYDISDDYTIIASDERDSATIDLSPLSEYDTRLGLELIVGTADPLDANNIRIIVVVNISGPYDLLDFTIYTEDSPREKVEVYNTYFSKTDQVCQIMVNSEDWSTNEKVHLGMSFLSEFSGLTAEVYPGLYETLDEITAAGVSAIPDIWDQTTIESSGGHLADYSYRSETEDARIVTLVVKRNNTAVAIYPFKIVMYESSVYLNDNGLYTEENGYRTRVFNRRKSQDGNSITYILKPGYVATDSYYLGLSLYNPDPNANGSAYGLKNVDKAVEGKYETKADADGATDIKDKLFSSPSSSGGGYLTDFSSGPVTFTVFTVAGEVLYYTVAVEKGPEEESLPSAPTPLSQDTYFHVTGALDTEGGGYSDLYNGYVMLFDDDSYYYNGYQTVFLLDDNNNAITDGTTIYPEFISGSKVEVFRGTDVDGQTASAEKQTSGESGITFTNGQALQYSAAAENGRHLKNYWVTFLTKQSGAALFVNGTNYTEHYEDGKPVREVFLTEEYGYHHDIFFANIGDAQLTGVTVTLTNAQNIALDDYWKIGDTQVLDAFSTTETTKEHGELSNVAKIRLVPAKNADGTISSGEISGTLTISADGIEPVTIVLKGTASLPKITTDTILDGVQYVPYSSVIQTNNMYEPDAVQFKIISGTLPSGVTLLENGELYGVPKQSGDFTFTVSASYDGTEAATKEFTLYVGPNENLSVWNYDSSIWGDNAYKINIAIPNEDMTVSSPFGDWEIDNNSWNLLEQVFETEGDFFYFENVWLDGEKLTRGTDYDAEEGSTKITILTQTLTRNGNGTHTIAAEFRDGNDNLRRAAQNYTLTTVGGSTSGSTNSGGGSSSSGATTYSIKLEQTNGGTIRSDRSSTTRGQKVTITVSPDAGYALDRLLVTDRNGNLVTVSETGKNQYTFVMPSGSVTVRAEFEEIPQPAPGLPFLDVRENDWFVPYVTDVYERGLMVGTSATTFEPDTTTSRGMIVKILYRLAGSPAVNGTYFSDVPLNQFYTDAVAWAEENGIVTGYGDGRFGPEDPITREQMVMILMSYAAYEGIDVGQQADLTMFLDSGEISSYAVEAMAWACAEGVINGKGNGILDPQGQATRAEVAAIFSRFCLFFETEEVVEK